MILKHKDPIQSAITCLETLASRTDLEPKTRKALQRELGALRRGEKGEKACAFHLDGVVKDHPQRVLIHDLRIEHDGEVAQFDHLLINCKLEMWILESKAYLHGFRISAQGEFEYWYDNHYHAMPSPIEQVKRQAHILEKVITAHGLAPQRLGFSLQPTIKTAILVDPKTRVIRPDAKVFPTDDVVIKADAFFTRYAQMAEKTGTMEVIGTLAKLVKKEIIADIGRRLVALHRPHQVDYRAKFGIPEANPACVLQSRPAEPVSEPTAPPSPPLAAPNAEPTCPMCGSAMMLRSAKRGTHVGGSFWGCSRYPFCRGMVAARPVASAPAHAAPTVETPTPPPVIPQLAATATPLSPSPACPRCGTTMVLRTAKQGGNPFWGCPTFPKCRGVIAIQGPG